MHVFGIGLVCNCMVGVGLMVRRWLFLLVHGALGLGLGVHGCRRTIGAWFIWASGSWLK